MATNNSVNISAAGLVKYDGAGTFSGVTITQYNLLVGGASNAITSLALTNGQLAIGSTGVGPSAATLTSGTGVNIVNGAGSITINAVGGGLTWSTITASTQSAVINSGYVVNYAGTCVITLPATSAVGSVITVAGINTATGWKIAQNAGNQIFMGNVSTTSGNTGYLESSAINDTVTLVCTTANANWQVISSIGNITYN